MRYIFTILICICSFFVSVAQEREVRTVETSAYGQLWEKIVIDYQPVDSLVVVGPIDKSDFQAMWLCCWNGNLRGIDLSQAQPENDELPEDAFFNEIQDEINDLCCQLQLHWITLPQGLKKIGNRAFQYTALRSLKIPETVAEMGAAVLCCNSKKIEEIVLPAAMSEISEWCFSACDANKIILHPNIKIINNKAFIDAFINEIVMPENGVETIGDRAFAYMYHLKKLVMPNSVTSFGSGNLIGLKSLQELTFSNSLTNLDYEDEPVDLENLEILNLPANVKTISNLINNCPKLRKLIFPKSLESVKNSFAGVSSGTVMYSCATVPPEADKDFLSGAPNGTLYVPVGSGDAYKKAIGWRNVSRIVELEEMPWAGVATAVTDTSTFSASASGGCIHITAPASTPYAVHTVSGQKVAAGTASGNGESIAVPKGAYIVTAQGKAIKLIL